MSSSWACQVCHATKSCPRSGESMSRIWPQKRKKGEISSGTVVWHLFTYSSIIHPQNNYDCLVVSTHLKNMSSSVKSVGMLTWTIYGKINNVPKHQPDDFVDQELSDWWMVSMAPSQREAADQQVWRWPDQPWKPRGWAPATSGEQSGRKFQENDLFRWKNQESLRQRCGTMRCWRYNEVYILHFWTFPDRANDKIAFNPSQPL